MNAQRGTAAVINDDVTQLRVLSGLLQKAGLKTVCFEGAEEALRNMEADQPPDLIVTDLYMPGLDGWRFCRLLRSQEYSAFNQVPILVVSATFAGEEAAGITAELGANAFLPSPVNGPHFLDLVDSLLSGERPREQLRVLIVEDSRSLAHWLKRAFESSGYWADIALNCHQALELFQESAARPVAVSETSSAKSTEPGLGRPYDIAVLDYHLPDGKGDSLLEAFRRIWPDCVCLMMTNDPDPGLALSLMKQGAAAYLRKPFQPDYLMDLCLRVRRERNLLRVEDVLEVRTRELKEQETKYSIVANDLPALLCRFKPDGTLTFVNSAYCEYFNSSEDELLGTSFFRFIPEAVRPQVMEHFTSLNKDRPSVRYEHQVVAPNGEIRWQQWIDHALFDRFGDILEYQSIGFDKTEEKQAEQALNLELSKRQLLLDTIDIQIWYLTDPETYGLVNQAHLDFLGLRFEDVAYKKLEAFVGPEVAEVCKAGNRNVFAQRRPIQTEEWIPNAAGEPRLIRITKTPKLDDRGRVEYVVCAGTDITHYRQIETALREQRDFAENLIATAQIIILVLDVEGRIVRYNPYMEELTGVSLEAARGRDWFETFLPERVRRQTRDLFEQALVGTAHTEGNLNAIQAQDGREIMVEWQNTVLKDNAGETTGLLVVGRDVTERLKTEEALRQSEEKFRLLAEHASDVIWVRDLDMKLQYVSPSVKRVRGYSPEEAMQQPLEDVLTPESAAVALEAFTRLLTHVKNGTPLEKDFTLELEHRCKGGGTKWLEGKMTLLQDSEGHPSGILGVSRDITERRQLEAERLELERRRRQLDKTESLSRMAGAVAHHFNNILTSVIGNLELARKGPQTGMFREQNLEQAENSARRAVDLSRQMLTFLGQVPKETALLDCARTCRTVAARCREEIPETVDFKVEGAKSGLYVRADAAQLEQLFFILISNAWEALGETPGQVRVAVDAADSGSIPDQNRFPLDWEQSAEVFVCVTVEDTGWGMDAETMDNIFDPFYSSKFTGRGLGLALALGILRSLDGCIAVESESSRGSVFRAFFPRMFEADSEPDSEPDQEASPGRKSSAETQTILFVDDDDMIRRMGEVMLERLGYEVLTARDGKEAVTLFQEKQSRICLVLCDLSMPEMDGRQTLAALQNLRPELPVILMSGYDEDSALKGHTQEQARSFLAKPFQMKDLQAAVEEALQS